MFIALGLGNPGVKYDGTRHNVGKEVVGALIAERRLRLSAGRGCYQFARDPAGELVLAIPTTYVNTSGQAAREALEHFGAPVESLLVVCDDFALPLGAIRMRKQGSYGGHNGLASIIYDLGSQDFPRLRIGVGPLPDGVDAADFVLSRFGADEIPVVEEAKALAREAVLVAAEMGLDRAMTRYNRSEHGQGPDAPASDGDPDEPRGGERWK